MGKRPCPRGEGNPINAFTGNKYLTEIDYVGSGVYPLRFERFYNSNSSTGSGRIGVRWRHIYDRSVTVNGTTAAILRPDGKQYVFTQSGGNWVGPADVMDRLVQIGGGGWNYIGAPNDETETYDTNGRLSTVANRSGVVHTLGYDGNSRLSTVTHSLSGRTLAFGYDGANRVSSLTDPSSQATTYDYDGSGNLSTVTYPGSVVRTYVYDEAAHTSGLNLPNYLTGIIDENSVRYATYKYDTSRRAVSTEHAGTTSKYSVAYTSATSSTVTDPLGKVRTLSAQTLLDVPRHTGVNEPCDGCGLAATIGYDANGYLSSAVDFNGRTSTYVHDTRGLETSRVEASGTPQQRTISTEWHATFRLVKKLAEPKRLTTYVFNGEGANCGPGGASTPAGLICSKTVQATTDVNGSAGLTPTVTGLARTWTYTYNAEGQILTENGPRTDVTDVTTYTYHGNSATCTATVTGASTTGCRGQVNTIINALSQVTTVSEYNAHGQPLKISDPNGLVTVLAYDARMRLTSRTISAAGVFGGDPEATTYEYWPTGLLKKATSPDASFVLYSYDDAHRLTQIEDSLGNKIVYTLDLMGNRTEEKIYAVSDLVNPAQKLNREYNNLNRLTKLIGGSNPLTQITQYGYDNQGNVTTVDGPLVGTADQATNAYDELNRLYRITSPVTIGGSPTTAVTEMTFDAVGQVTKMKDPRLLETNYTVDGLGNRTVLASPDTGSATSTYDAAGNVLTQTDAKGQLTTYTYDALNRVTTITYQGGVVYTFQYDQNHFPGVSFGKGRLTQVSSTAGNLAMTFRHNIKGRLFGEVVVFGSPLQQYPTTYSYDQFGRLTGITYPGGRQVSYTLDALGRVQQISTTKGGVTQTVVSSVAYHPFGGAKQFNYGNGQSYARGIDLDGRISSYTLGTMSVAVSYDPASRITKLAAAGQSDRTYSYDELDRLMGFVYGSANQAFGYDGVGNRTSKQVGAATDTYNASPTSNRLATITGSNPRTYSYDNNGAVTGDGTNTYGYDTRGRMNQATSAIGTTTYTVDSLGRRLRKVNVDGDNIYHYDKDGRLIAEGTSAGQIRKEYIYLGTTPVAVIQ